MSYRFAVIGSNSFSGAHFVRHLLDSGDAVLGISRSEEPAAAYLPYRWGGEPSRFEFRQLDLNRDLAGIIAALNAFRPDYVVNFAAQGMVAESWQHPTDWFQTNVVAQVALHDELRKMSFIQRYLHFSTPEVYGSCGGHVSEDQALNPSTPYAVSRAAADLSLRTFVQNYGFPVVTTRAANVYGPGQQLYRIIPRTLLALRTGTRIPLHGGGNSVRSFIHIRDVVDGTRRAAIQGQTGETYHLATSDSISIRKLVERMCRRVGVGFEDAVDVAPERPGKDLAYLLDTTRARTRLGWSDAIALDEGIEDTLSWIDANLDFLRQEHVGYVHRP